MELQSACGWLHNHAPNIRLSPNLRLFPRYTVSPPLSVRTDTRIWLQNVSKDNLKPAASSFESINIRMLKESGIEASGTQRQLSLDPASKEPMSATASKEPMSATGKQPGGPEHSPPTAGKGAKRQLFPDPSRLRSVNLDPNEDAATPDPNQSNQTDDSGDSPPLSTSILKTTADLMGKGLKALQDRKFAKSSKLFEQVLQLVPLNDNKAEFVDQFVPATFNNGLVLQALFRPENNLMTEALPMGADYLVCGLTIVAKQVPPDEIVASLSSEVIFYMDLAIFLLVTDHVQKPYLQFSPKRWGLITGLRGFLTSAFFTIGFKVIAPLFAVYVTWPMLGLPALVSVVPFLLGCLAQYLFETRLDKRGSSCWPLVPIIFEVYRLYQLSKAAHFIERMMFAMKGVPVSPEVLERSGAVVAMIVTFQVLGVVCLWSLMTFLRRLAPSRPVAEKY